MTKSEFSKVQIGDILVNKQGTMMEVYKIDKYYARFIFGTVIANSPYANKGELGFALNHENWTKVVKNIVCI